MFQLFVSPAGAYQDMRQIARSCRRGRKFALFTLPGRIRYQQASHSRDLDIVGIPAPGCQAPQGIFLYFR